MTHASNGASPEAATPHAAPETSVEAPATGSFHNLGLAPQVLAVLDKLGFTVPTPIQSQAIPVGLDGSDIIGIAQTGTGKTLAFALPILHRYVQNGNRLRGRVLVILPTRELALQVEETFSKVGRAFGLRSVVLIGGAPMRPQQAELRRNPDIIVATPGRLIDHAQQRNVDLRTVDTLILDEADRMLDMGFAPQIKQILREVPEERQTLLFSATMPTEIVSIAQNYMAEPVRVEVAQAGTAAERVTQEMVIVPQDNKNEILEQILRDYKGTVLIFARTRSRAHRVARTIRNMGHDVAEIHSDRTLIQRRAALDGFKDGTYRVLVATDIAARGIDVTGIELVLNYDLPDTAEDYVHRIGRTGRAGQEGHAISFAAPDQAKDLRDIEKLIRSAIDISNRSTVEFDRVAPSGRTSSRRSSAPPPRGPRSQGSGGPRPTGGPRRPSVSRPEGARDSQSSSGGSSGGASNGAPRQFRRVSNGR
jgi:ATP-dependent RNA helicase RhlE